MFMPTGISESFATLIVLFAYPVHRTCTTITIQVKWQSFSYINFHEDHSNLISYHNYYYATIGALKSELCGPIISSYITTSKIRIPLQSENFWISPYARMSVIRSRLDRSVELLYKPSYSIPVVEKVAISHLISHVAEVGVMQTKIIAAAAY